MAMLKHPLVAFSSSPYFGPSLSTVSRSYCQVDRGLSAWKNKRVIRCQIDGLSHHVKTQDTEGVALKIIKNSFKKLVKEELPTLALVSSVLYAFGFVLTPETMAANALDICEPVAEVNLDIVMTMRALILGEIAPGSARLVMNVLGPILASFNLLFIVRIVMSWYPQLPVNQFPFVIVYAPTEPVLDPTRKLIPPVGGVDVSPVIWVAVLSFLNEILLGQQGLLVLLSQQQ